jgi:hypothetical protein
MRAVRENMHENATEWRGPGNDPLLRYQRDTPI